ADLALLMAELQRPQRILDASTIASATTPQFPDLAGVLPGFGSQNPNPWGLGVEIRGQKTPHWTAATCSPATFGHFGQSGTCVWVDPVARLGLVGRGDADFGEWAVNLWPALGDAVLAGV